MEIELLRTFVEVAEAQGITSAARRLGVSKSLVSRRLARIERELGVQLLARTTHGTALTESGVTFREHAAKICIDYDTAAEAIRPWGEVRGRLRVAAPLSFGPTHIAPILSQMARRHPHLQIHSCYTDRFVDLVGEGFDCAIRMGHLPDQNLVAKRVGPIFGKLVASPAYIEAYGAPNKPDEIANHHTVIREDETWRFTDGAKVITVRPQGRFIADNGISLVAAALDGVGIAYLPEKLVAGYIDSGSLVPIMLRYPIPPAGIFIIRSQSQYPTRKVRILTEMLAEYFGDPAVTDGMAGANGEFRLFAKHVEN